MRSRAWISATAYSKAYLGVAWRNRGQLKGYERRGFGQFFYLVLCGHVECVLSDSIHRRLKSIRIFLDFERLPPVKMVSGENEQYYSVRPLSNSVRKIVSAVKADTDNAPLSKLLEIHNRVFPKKLEEMVGRELLADVRALADLRNLFVHGREIFMEFDGGNNGTAFRGDLEGNPLRAASERLYSGGVLKRMEIDGANYDLFYDQLFSDAALRYFDKSVKTLESLLSADPEFTPEAHLPKLPALPELDDV